MDRIVRDALGHAETHLTRVSRGREQQVLTRWRRECSELTEAPIRTLAELKGWVHRLPADRADEVLRYLVTEAQRREPSTRPPVAAATPADDALALLAVIVCLAPGIRSLASRSSIGSDEAVSELALGILDFPVERRTRVAAGLLLDARNRLHRHAQRQNRCCSLDEATAAESRRPQMPGDPQEARPAAQRVVQMVCQAHRAGILNHADARLILHTRIGGHQVQPIATELGLSTTAAYQRRSRAEARLGELVA
jgi:hypothetical protein